MKTEAQISTGEIFCSTYLALHFVDSWKRKLISDGFLFKGPWSMRIRMSVLYLGTNKTRLLYEIMRGLIVSFDMVVLSFNFNVRILFIWSLYTGSVFVIALLLNSVVISTFLSGGSLLGKTSKLHHCGSLTVFEDFFEVHFGSCSHSEANILRLKSGK